MDDFAAGCDHDRNGIHLRRGVADPCPERTLAIGALPVSWDSYPDDPDFIVLADPDGNRFCIVDLSHAPD